MFLITKSKEGDLCVEPTIDHQNKEIIYHHLHYNGRIVKAGEYWNGYFLKKVMIGQKGEYTLYMQKFYPVSKCENVYSQCA